MKYVVETEMTGDSLTPEVLLAVGIAVVVVIVSLIFLARPKGKDADLLDQLRSARVEIRDLLDSINCGTFLRPPWWPKYSCSSIASHLIATVRWYKSCGAAARGGFAGERFYCSAPSENAPDLRTYG